MLWPLDIILEDHERLAATLAGIQWKSWLSINDHQEMRKVYGRFDIRKIETSYSINRDKEAYRIWGIAGEELSGTIGAACMKRKHNRERCYRI